uniref:Uncharacterized protein n=1 Tax=viral metagenome TaxID=1070528 RepID=A0A6C0F5G3_9ZZZZ
MNPVGATTSTTSTVMKFFLLVTACIVINIFLYLIEDKWIGGVFSGAWLLAIVLTYLYNRGFDLNITNYSLTTLLRRYFLPIVTYIIWIGVIYWLITAQIDIAENTEHSQLSRNFAGVMTGFIPVLAGVITFYSINSQPVGWAILISIVLLFIGSYSYYLNTLREGCDKNISDTICWTYAANATFLGFILITGLFIWLSTKDLVGGKKYIQFLPRILTIDPTSPLSIFSIFTYLLMWISFIIVFFRHDKEFLDEQGYAVNATFTGIGLFMLVLLFFKETQPMINFINKFIKLIMYIFNQPLSTKLLHAAIITTFILSIYFTGGLYRGEPDADTYILTLDVILSVLFIGYLIFIIYNYIKS